MCAVNKNWVCNLLTMYILVPSSPSNFHHGKNSLSRGSSLDPGIPRLQNYKPIRFHVLIDLLFSVSAIAVCNKLICFKGKKNRKGLNSHLCWCKSILSVKSFQLLHMTHCVSDCCGSHLCPCWISSPMTLCSSPFAFGTAINFPTLQHSHILL